ncbi:hypothetical protein AB7828_22390 [Tardiphaga sp. 215_C5_N2_1]|uniref:hypothetical protein n=1 Tax=Tardiphaga sp. 215_C5_N2_1 TaxID=3240774 RepID=UPI003F8B7A01
MKHQRRGGKTEAGIVECLISVRIGRHHIGDELAQFFQHYSLNQMIERAAMRRKRSYFVARKWNARNAAGFPKR